MSYHRMLVKLAKKVAVYVLLVFMGLVILLHIRDGNSNAQTDAVFHDDTYVDGTGRLSQNGKAHGNVAVSFQSHNEKECQIIDIGLRCATDSDVRDAVILLKTILFYRPHGALRLHVSASDHVTGILKTLLTTWELRQVKAVYYPLKDPRLYNAIPTILKNVESSVQRIIFLDVRMRLTTNIADLWDQFNQFPYDRFIGYVVSKRAQAPHDCVVCVHDVFLVDITKARETVLDQIEAETIMADIHLSKLFELPSAWFVELDSDYPLDTLTAPEHIRALRMSNLANGYLKNDIGDQAREKINQISGMDGDLFGHQHSGSVCLITPEQATNKTIAANADCTEFRKFANLPKRVHRYFIGSPPASNGPYDLSMLTQLTLDRFAVLETLVQRWAGPLHVLLYITDYEAVKLVDKVAGSKLLHGRKNLAVHVVYRRKNYYPINFLRNILIKECTTPYLIFNDVDLVPPAKSYSVLQEHIQTFMHGKPNVTLVVPAFELFETTFEPPNNREEMLQYLKENKTIGYRMNRGWNVGHKATDYPKWKRSEKPYFVPYSGAFEPYAVLPAARAPFYDERLLERMADKIAYGVHLSALGYKYLVLHDVFISHVPHDVSEGTRIWKTNSNYFRCGSVLYKEFRRDLQAQMPSVTLPGG